MNYRKYDALATMVAGLAISAPVQAHSYFQNFEGIPGFNIADAGFTGKFWELGTDAGNKFMISTTPGGAKELSEASSPAFSFPVDREERGGFTVQYQLRYSGSGECDDGSPVPVKTDVDLLDASGHVLFTLAFQSNNQSNINRANLVLTNHATNEVHAASTGSVTPLSSGTVNLRLMYLPAGQETPGIQVFYGEKQEFRPTPLIVDDYGGAVQLRRLVFRHTAGAGGCENQVRVDDILVRPNDVIALPASPDNGFDRVLFASDGSNPDTVFRSDDLYQGTFRLTRSIVPQGILSDWDRFQEGLAAIDTAAVGIQGIPLLVTKANFLAVGSGSVEESHTFYMAAFSRDKVAGQHITILTSPGFQVTDNDEVTAIRLELDGQTLNLPLAGTTEFHFSTPGEKTALATVTFASGFVGQNSFRIQVGPTSP